MQTWQLYATASLFIVAIKQKCLDKLHMQAENRRSKICCLRWTQIRQLMPDSWDERESSRDGLQNRQNEKAKKRPAPCTIPPPQCGKRSWGKLRGREKTPVLLASIPAAETWHSEMRCRFFTAAI